MTIRLFLIVTVPTCEAGWLLGYLVNGLLGSCFVWLFGYLIIGLLGLFGYWDIGLLGYWFVGVLG